MEVERKATYTGLSHQYCLPTSSSRGFTLLELIIATVISTFVIGILSVCFSFALQVWQSNHNQKPDQTFLLADLLQRQLAECDPTPVKLANNAMHLIFLGRSNSITFVTAYSIKAISQGVPVVARYEYDPDSKVLAYSERVMDPYHPELIEKFIAEHPAGRQKDEIHSYGVDIPEFVLAYAGMDSKEFSQTWDATDAIPVEILLTWKSDDLATHRLVCMVDSPFTIEIPKVIGAPVQGGLPQGGLPQ